jgi:hypothetical protein
MDDERITRKDLVHLQEQLELNIKLSQDNNEILHAMRKWGRVAFVAKVVIWTIVLLVPVLLYPYIASSTSENGLFGYPSPTQFEKILHPGK